MQEVQGNTSDLLFVCLQIEEELLCKKKKTHVQKLRWQTAAPEDLTAQLKWPDDYQSQPE